MDGNFDEKLMDYLLQTLTD